MRTTPLPGEVRLPPPAPAYPLAIESEGDAAPAATWLSRFARMGADASLFLYCFASVTVGVGARFNALYRLSALIAAAAVGLLLFVRRGRELPDFLRDRFCQRYALFTLATLVALLVAPNSSTRTSSILLLFILTIVVFAHGVLTNSSWPVFYGFLAGIVVIVLTAGSAAIQAAEEGQRMRYAVGDDYVHPNRYGFMLLLVLLFSVQAMFVSNRLPGIGRTLVNRLHQIVALLAALLCTHQIVTVTGSRKAMLLLLVAGVGAGLLYLSRRLSLLRLALAAVIGTAGLAGGWILIERSPFFERFLTMQEFVDGGGLTNHSSLERSEMISAGLYMWLESPLIGHGPGYFRDHSGFEKYSHSNPVEILVSLGLLGAVLYYGAIWAIVRPCLGRLRDPDPFTKTLATWVLLLFCCLLSAEVAMVVTFGHMREHSIILGVAAAYAFRLRHSRLA